MATPRFQAPGAGRDPCNTGHPQAVPSSWADGQQTVMAEGFELVRTIRQHLRRGAALLDEGKLDEALAETNAALALDAQSLPAQALRDRIERARPAASTGGAPAASGTSSSFVPHGVNAASWRGFEQRITERRFRALLETVNTSIVAGDAAAARVALDEARELRPDAAELAAFEARVAAVPVTVAATEVASSARVWMRAMGAAALFLIGVSMFIGLELIRPAQTVASAPVSTAVQPAVAPADDFRVADLPEAEPVPQPTEEDDSVPAIIMPPEPTLRPRGTTGNTAPPVLPVAEPVARREIAPPIISRETPLPAAATASARPIESRPVQEDLPIRPLGEVPDDYVAEGAPVRAASNESVLDTARPADVTRSPVPQPRAPSTSVPMTANNTAAAAADTVVPAAVVTSPADTSRVEEVLLRYARAYDSLDASAARAVWPSVNEKALARAFQDLSSQNVQFNNCDINIRGAVANASCSGEASYVVKVGSREPRTEPRLWRFELRRDGDAWKIENAETRRQATSASSYRDR
jgi:tetratricopeptide (TPR) repeat protein